MSSKAVQKRQTKLLTKLAALANYRTDNKISLKTEFPTIGIKRYAGGTRFVNIQSSSYEGGCDTSYDFNHLLLSGFIEATHLRYQTSNSGAQIGEGDAVRLTKEGIERVTELQRSWFSRAIEKQPATTFQVFIAIVQILWTVALAIWTWYVLK